MKKILTVLSFWTLAIILVPCISLAQTAPVTPSSSPMLDKLQIVGGAAGFDDTTDQSTVLEVVGAGISIGLSLLGVIFIILILIAGYNRMTAAGDEEKITKSNKTIREAIIGLLIIVASYAIWMFISNVLIGEPTIG